MKFNNLTDLTLDSLLVEKTGEQRSPGVHLSDVLRTMQQDVAPQTYGKPGSPFAPDATTELRFVCGFNFEYVMEQAFARRCMAIERIGEVEVDGIIGSPDGVDMKADPPELLETKFTWKSTRGTPWPCDEHEFIREDCDQCSHVWDSKHWWWQAQMMAYCYMLGLHVGVLRVLFVNGNYSTMAPCLRAWRFEWTQDELLRHWAQLLKQAREKGML